MKLEKIAQIQTVDKMRTLKFEQFSNIIAGNPRKAKKKHQEYSKLAVDNFDLVVNMTSHIKATFPLFSKIGFNILKYIIFDLFSKDSIEEKQLKKLWKEFKSKKSIKI